MAVNTITDEAFRELISDRARTLLGIVKHISECESNTQMLIRPLMGALLMQSTQIEELLDAYGARNNCQWCGFRSLTAALKLFSDVSYELLHIRHSLSAYRLLTIEQDFVKATDETLAFTADVLRRAADQMLLKAQQLGLSVPPERPREKAYKEDLPIGRLARRCVTHQIETVSETVTLLTTAFLNLAAESKDVRAAGRARPAEYVSYVRNTVTEKRLRSLELQFHTLQSLYDTYVSGTEAEELDTNLPVLRGHISVVFHLFRSATHFVHHYERHLNRPACESAERQAPLVEGEALLDVLMKYSITHINLYITCAENLCREMLKRYAEVGQIEVPVPPYRGFHVRPSTLISKLVLHYGSEIQMAMDDELYDASSPLDLFRANEKINAEKRRWLAAEIARLGLVEQENDHGGDVDAVIRHIVLTLAGCSKLILYEQPLELPDGLFREEATPLQKIMDAMKGLLALGKIDVEANLTVRFIGDKRVLADIKLLAESGYGENNFGSNVPLPEKLEYLRR